ncbi:Rne/Rng family ribonuclease [Candidatus Pelagibacter sp. RS40]|uniref:Rne/Rng family ribonuclease n=1 Tax=Candidatus Pelagibacter sp. RS40 TaxID=1977865 RepID=UPI000A1680ED|nr:Rne/Rng family ribonuclease [Candidatus Pelagibacter sp. RS40]ARJ48652.1 ribonuclease E/G [Candidatus Pelagibacter sp. RS40]
MSKNLYIDASHPNETRVVLKNENHIEDYEYESINNTLIKNNIYLGKVSRIEPSLQAAFVDFGRERHGFLSFNDIQSDYYQIPQSDLEKIKEEEEKVREELSKESENIENKILDGEEIKIEDPVEKREENVEEKNDDKIQKRFPSKRYKIQEVIKPNQVILVQVLKDERGLKGAALSTFISIAGKYIVLMPNTAKGGGISRKIFNPGDRKKIRNILNEIEIPKAMGIIVRTAGSNKTKNEIDGDLKNLITVWDSIKSNAMNSMAPSLIHQESDIIKRSIRDMYDDDTQNILVEGNEGYQKAKNYMKLMMPKQLKKVKKYRDKIPLFFKENIEKKLFEIFKTEVKLSSGGYLVINPTEALVSIDINSGKSIKQKNVESTALDTNLEAAEEIARQIKIRDLSGLIIIDFIDMLNFGNRRLVERRLKEKCRNDRARIQIGRISNFGLLEMSRQRLRESNIKWSIKLTNETFAQKIIKLIEIKSLENSSKIIDLKINNKISDFIENQFLEDLKYFEKKNKIKINITNSEELNLTEYLIEFKSKSGKILDKIEKIESLQKVVITKENSNSNIQKPFKKRKFKKRKFVKKKIK